MKKIITFGLNFTLFIPNKLHYLMFSAFKKKEDRPQNGSEKKSFSLEELESELNVLNKTDLSKVEGGKDTKKSLTDISGLRNSMGGTIPL
ncbi:MAG TPA: hypothetical protein DCF33_17230 [Saprospirales bacterium]|nr:hypothetical protein [Saprospirales bacterium]